CVGDLDVSRLLRLVSRARARRRREDRPDPARAARAHARLVGADLGETVTSTMLVAALAVLACVLATQRTRVRSAHDEGGRRRALDHDGDLAQRAALPRAPHHPE